MEVISFDKATLLPLSFVLNNVLLTNETLDWTKRIGQSTIFLGLIFGRPITTSFEIFYSKPWRNLTCLHKWSLWLRLFFQIHKLQWISIVILQISLTLERVQGKVAQWSHTFLKNKSWDKFLSNSLSSKVKWQNLKHHHANWRSHQIIS